MKRPARILTVFALFSMLAPSALGDGLGETRARFLAEARLDAFVSAGAARSGLGKDIEWHAGRILWFWEREGGGAEERLERLAEEGLLESPYRGADPAVQAAAVAPVLIAAWQTPGQRFHQSARLRATLVDLAETLAEGARRRDDALSETELRSVVLQLMDTIAVLQGHAARAWEREMLAVAEQAAASPPARTADAMWRARARFALSCLFADSEAARQAAEKFANAAAERAFAEPEADAHPVRRATMAADALAMASWTQGTQLWIGDEIARQALWLLRYLAEHAWLGTTFDPLRVVAPLPDALGGAALREAALRARALGAQVPVATDFVPLWRERKAACPPAAAMALRFWGGGTRPGARPLRGVQWSEASEGYHMTAECAAGRLSLNALAFEGNVWKARDGVGRFNVYEGERAKAYRMALAEGFAPGDLIADGMPIARPAWSLEAANARRTPRSPVGMAAMASLEWSWGEASVKADRTWAAWPGGFLFAFSSVEGKSATRLGRPWVCLPGRDRRTRFNIAFPARESFDAVRLKFAPDGERWQGVARSVRVRVSDDEASWTLVGEGHGIVNPLLPSEPVESVTIPFDRVRARHLSLSFPEGGVGNALRILEVQVLRTARDAAGRILQESDDLALATRGAVAAADSSLSADHAARNAIDGVASLDPAPFSSIEAALFLAPASEPVAAGIEGERGERRLEAGAAMAEIGGAEWLHDGAAGYILSRPADIVLRRLGNGWAAGSVVLTDEPFAVLVQPGVSAEETERIARGGHVAWRALSPELVWVELSEFGEGAFVAFDAMSSDHVKSEDVCCLVYRRDGVSLGVVGDWERKMRVGLDMPDIESVTVNGAAVPLSLNDLATFPLDTP